MYKCNKCENTSAMKLWKCPSCGAFGSFVEEIKSFNNSKSKHSVKTGSVLKSGRNEKISFLKLGDAELNRIFQRWIKQGGMYLLWWEPGIGKSTILLQIILDVLNNNPSNIWYFSGEESVEQINDRLDRIGEGKENNVSNLSVYHTMRLEDILSTIEENKHNFMVVDSIQTIYTENTDSVAGSPSQVRYCTEKLSEFAKANKITCFVVGHVTKWWEIAGPKYLEHIVDAVLYLEWDRFGQYRFLRTKKNRFWRSDETGIFEMTLFGLQAVYDLKDKLIWAMWNTVSGSLLTVGIDNGRPVIINLEVLLNKTKGNYPKRVALWVDGNRLDIIIAIMEKYLNINLGFVDIFVNLPGEFVFKDSWLDLAIAVAIYSQYKDKVIDKNSIFLGEIWLWGQILKSKFHDKRKKELPEGFALVDFDSMKNIVEIGNVV